MTIRSTSSRGAGYRPDGYQSGVPIARTRSHSVGGEVPGRVAGSWAASGRVTDERSLEPGA